MKYANLMLILFIAIINTHVMASFLGGGVMSLEDGMFWGADLNRNECLDRDEAKAVHNLAEDEIFERYDKNANNCISRFEFMEFMQQSPWTKSFVPPGDQEY